MITPEEFAVEMKRISEENQPDTGHKKADYLMILILRHYGYGDGCDIFEKMQKWYN